MSVKDLVTETSRFSTKSGHASRVHYKVAGLAMLLAMITYLDRACIATLAPNIMHDLSLTKGQMSWVYSIFAFSYALFGIPTAWWADRIGTRRILTRIVVWWSVFTMATALAVNLVSLLAIRFLFGAGEAGAWPAVARTFFRWIPRKKRGAVQGSFFAGAHIASGLAPLLVLALVQVVNWRVVFIFFGSLGCGWALIWHRWFRDDPASHPEVNAMELEHITAGQASENERYGGWKFWRQLLSQRNVLLLCCMYFPNSFAFYFCITWLPTYLKECHGFTAMSLGFFAGLPLVLSVAGDLFGGFTTDAVARRFGLRIGRSLVGVGAYLIAGVGMIFAAETRNPVLAGYLIALAVAASMFVLGTAWATCIDIGGDNAGVVSAVMNTSGQIGAVISPLMVTGLLDLFGSWNASLFVMGGLFLIGATCWCFIDPRKRVFE
ncbi:MAG TPA: MFS transporter [Verrucomicrobiae bacterium]|nr:MFS transporter [Verrucomicrobiae bacterium]